MQTYRWFLVMAATGVLAAVVLATSVIASQSPASTAQAVTGSALAPEEESKPSQGQAGQKDSQARVAAATLSPDDKRFIEQAAKGGVAEVQEAKLAQQKAANADVKRGATSLEADHKAANARLKTIAEANGVTPPAEPGPDRKALYERLQKLQGPEFDAEYLRAGVAAHEKTIELFEKTQKQSQNAEVRKFAGETLPTLRHHLEMMKQMQQGK